MKKPACPFHGERYMYDMAHVGAPLWYTCSYGAEHGAPCGKSGHIDERPERLAEVVGVPIDASET